MSKALRTSLVVIGVVVASAVLILVGIAIARTSWASPWGWHGVVSPEFDGETSDAIPLPFGGRMGLYLRSGEQIVPYESVNPGIMGGYGLMMDSYGMMNGGYSMMGGYGMMSGMSMMGGRFGSGLLGVDPITLESAESAVEEYLSIIQDDNLQIGEIMIFDNHAYAQIIEANTGIGAMEVLVDPVTFAVSPEPGPNMMWNLKYSPMAGFGGFGMMGMTGMMGGYGTQGYDSMDGMMDHPTSENILEKNPLSPQDAVEVAQRYLDAYLTGTEADVHADPFYGYYTIHILKDGETVGMLSVNGYTRQVFLHTWHGTYLSSSDH